MNNIRKIIGNTVGTPMNPDKVKPTVNEIKEAVDNYLSENPVVGTPGKDGVDGKDGKDGINGVDGKDGATGPAGADGKDGEDGKTPEIGANGNWWIDGVDTGITALGTVIQSVTINETGHLIVTFTDGSPLDVGLVKGADGAAGKDGTDGKDGVNGRDGDPGYTPVKGVDYFTEDDKAEIIDELSQQTQSLDIVSSVDEMTDPTKKYVNSQTGTIWECTERTETVPGGTVVNFANVFDPETATVGSRWSSSSKAPTTSAGAPCILSDFIPCNLSSGEHTIRIKNGQLHGASSNAGIAYFSSNTNDSQIFLVNNLGATPTEEADSVLAYKLGEQNGSMISNYANTRYIRCVAVQYNGTNLVTPQTAANAENIIITIDEPITYTTTEDTTETYYEWTDTGEVYTSTGNEAAIMKNAADIAELKEDIADLKEAEETDTQSDTVMYAIGDSITAGLYAGGTSKSWVAHVINHNGYSASSQNLGVSGIGFVRADPTTSKTIRDVVNANSFANANLVTVAVGINDWQNSCDIATVKTEMEYCFSKILTDNPYCKIFFITPFNKNRGEQATNWALGYTQGTLTLEQFVAEQISVCESIGIEVIDMTHSSVINKYNLTSVLYDNTHPNEACHTALGKELARKITFA